MYTPPDIAYDLVKLRHSDLIAEAERHRLARLARGHQRRHRRVRRTARDARQNRLTTTRLFSDG